MLKKAVILRGNASMNREGLMSFFFFIICFFASIVGAICGIGGGVIIKPVLDATGVLDVSVVSFLSGCTVLSMTAYSVAKSRFGGESELDLHISFPLAAGAAGGGLLGKWLFSLVKSMSGDPDRVGAVQAGCLLAVTAGTLVYTLLKHNIKTHQVRNRLVCILIGLILGVMSSFLGIGGGPVNLVLLFYFFSMSTKTAAENSLYIILFSQITGLLQSIVTQTVPVFAVGTLLVMVAGGIGGGVCGRAVTKKMKDETVDRLFIGLMILMIAINAYNIVKFL